MLMSATRATPIKVGQPNWMFDGDDSEVEEAEGRKREGYLKRRFGGPLDVILGKPARLALALILLAGFATWWQQNQGRHIAEEGIDVASRRRALDINTDSKFLGPVLTDKITTAYRAADNPLDEPLRVKFVPTLICEILSGYKALVAGALLLLSCIIDGKLATILVLAGVGIVLVGARLNIPVVKGHDLLAMGAGAGVAIAAMFFLRRPGQA
jgi:hypothetical protein